MNGLPRKELLLPINPFFVLFSLVTAFLGNMALGFTFGRVAWLPDLLALVLVFWTVHQPRLVGIGMAFLFGLCMDVHESTLLGQHAMAYTIMAFGAAAIHRRILWFAVLEQTIQVIPIFLGMHAVSLMLRLLTGAMWPGWSVVLPPFFEALLWPVASVLLLAPQRRAPDPDKHRPL
jgi:rod shape-determining protein MreD